MILCVEDVLTTDELSQAREILAGVAFEDGSATPNAQAPSADRNEQAVASDGQSRAATLVANAVMRNLLFQMAVVPRTISSIVFNRHSEGMAYGQRVDPALINGRRSDVSFTVFLTDPEDYGGGELVMALPHGDQPIRLPAGQMVAYPSATPYQVAEVTSGARLCAVGYVRSLVRDPTAREILFDIEMVRRALLDRHGPGRENDLLGKSYANLMRRWAED